MSGPNTISFSLRDSLRSTVDYATKRASFDLIMARVSYVLLDDSDKNKFTSLGGWRALGTIECRPFVNSNFPEAPPVIARPISSNLTRFPLVNEIVILKVYVSKEAQNNFDNYKPEIYYTDIISLFNATEENAAPDSSYFKLNPNEKYVTGKYIPSGEIKRLIKAPGDVTLEGRRGNSIRMGTSMTGFNTPWVSSEPSPILVISNNPQKTSGSSARFESINDDGSTIMLMSGHNVSFQPASSNFDSYNTKISIPEKNNIVVYDPPKPKETESLKQEDEKPIPKETPKPTPIPVAVATPPNEQTAQNKDDEEMPEREDLLQIDIDFEDIPVSIETVESTVVNFEEVKEKAKINAENNVGKKPGTSVKNRTYISQAAATSIIVTNNLRTYSGTGFLPKLTKICEKYKIDVKDMLVIMAMESGKYPQRARLNKKDGTPQAVGIIQFTDAKKNSVFQNIRKQEKFSSLRTLADIADVPVIKEAGKYSKYDFDQLDLVDFYLSNISVLQNPKNGKVDRYGLYGAIFYPAIVERGTIDLPDYEILGEQIKGSQEKKLNNAWAVAVANPAISGKVPQLITIKMFKDYIDSKFGNTLRK